MPTTDPLVSTEWLAAHIGDPNVRVIDASFKMPGILPLPKDDYLASHLPGAVFFDVDAVSDHSNPLPHMFPSAEQFGRDVGGLGIGNDDTVMLYDSGGWVAAARVWWMFLSFGKEVRILNGGLKKWVAEGRKVEKGEVTPKPATFKAAFDARRVRSMEQLVTNLSSRAEQVIDARANERYQGKVAEPRPGLRSGHIPRLTGDAIRTALTTGAACATLLDGRGWGVDLVDRTAFHYATARGSFWRDAHFSGLLR